MLVALGSRGAHPSPVVSPVLSWENGVVLLRLLAGIVGTARKRRMLLFYNLIISNIARVFFVTIFSAQIQMIVPAWSVFLNRLQAWFCK
jgi:hypothetical protein